jgi:hypothetical protein
MDGLLILFLTFGKGKRGVLIPAVILAVLAIGVMFYNAEQTELFYIGALLLVGVWALKVGIE